MRKKRRRSYTHPVAELPPRLRYILARRRRRVDLQPMPSPWLPLTPRFALMISGETPSQLFPRFRFLDMELDIQDLLSSLPIPSNPSPPRSKHATQAVIPLEIVDVSPLASLVETMVHVQLPHIGVPHRSISPDLNPPSPPQPGIDTPAQQQQQQERQQEQKRLPSSPLRFLNFL